MTRVNISEGDYPDHGFSCRNPRDSGKSSLHLETLGRAMTAVNRPKTVAVLTGGGDVPGLNPC
ncbi:MAG: hypothetical protein ACFFCW_44290, partial [Candidatus Hodarchaeota archaeon]